MRADQRVALTGVLQKQRKDIKYLGKARSSCSYVSRQEGML